jgi:hypothetical protein
MRVTPEGLQGNAPGVAGRRRNAMAEVATEIAAARIVAF